jgi:hypothetical protein
MYKLVVAAATMAAGLVATPAIAAERIECMDSGYSAAEMAATDAYVAGVDVSGPAMAAPEPVLQAIRARAAACSSQHSWNAAASQHAYMYRLLSLVRAGLRRRTTLDAAVMARVDAAVDAADITQLVPALMAAADMSRGGTQLTPQQIQLIMSVIDAAQTDPSPESMRFVGAWATARALMRDASIQFAAS